MLELLIVLVILVAVAGLVIVLSGTTYSNAQVQATQVSMQHLRDAIVGTVEVPGFQTDTGTLPATLYDLFINRMTGPGTTAYPPYDPNTRIGWRGPYISNPSGTYAVDATHGFTSGYGNTGDPAILDAWGHPIVLQIPTQQGNPILDAAYARLVSAGPNGTIDTPPTADIPVKAACGDDLFVYLTRQDDRP